MSTLSPILIPIFAKDGVSTGLQKSMRKLDSFGKKFKKMGNNLSKFVTAPIAGIGVASVLSFNKLNESMANVATLIPGRSKRVLELRDSVESLATETGIAATDISEGLFQVISAFGESSDSAAQLNAVVKAGKAGRASTVESLNLLSAVTKGYGDTSSYAIKKASDLAFMTNKLGQTTFPEMAASMGKVIPLSKKMNVAQEEMFAIMASLTGVTGNTAEVSTQLSGVLSAFIKPSEDMLKTMKMLGFETGETMIKELGLVGALKKVIGETDGSSVQIGKLITRKEALNAAFALTGEQADKFSESLEAMRKASGATEDAYREQTEGINKLGFRMSKALQVLMKMARSMGEYLAPHVINLTEKITKLGKWFLMLSPVVKKIIIALGVFASVIGPIILAFGFLASGIAVIIPILVKLKLIFIAIITLFKVAALALAGLSLPVIGIIAGIAALTAGIVLLIKNKGKVVEFFKSIGSVISDFFISAVNLAMDKLTSLLKVGQKITSFVGGLFGGSQPITSGSMEKAGKAAVTGQQKIFQESNMSGRLDVNFNNLPTGSKVKSSSDNMDLFVRRGLMGVY